MIAQLQRSDAITEEGVMTERMSQWTQSVTRLDTIVGTGSPEGVIEAFQTQQYMDDAGTAGSILYIKRDADIAGDRTTGWILV